MFFTFNLAFNYYNDVMSSEELTDLSPVFILSLYRKFSLKYNKLY